MSIYPVHHTVLPTVGDGDPVGLAVDENGRLIVSGTITVTGPLTDAELRATPVPVAPAPASSVESATITATVTPAPLASQACSSLLIQVDPDATEDVFFGSSSAQYMQLVPGASVVVRVSNANLIYVKTAQNTAAVNTFASV